MKRAVLLAGLLVSVGFLLSLEACGPKRYLKKETTTVMVGMKSVFVGWVDLEPDDWALHGYSGSCVTRFRAALTGKDLQRFTRWEAEDLPNWGPCTRSAVSARRG
jgi:hypothetical protein